MDKPTGTRRGSDRPFEPHFSLPRQTAVSTAAPTLQYAPLLWLALGAFAVGTESFMIAAILPAIARDLAVGVAAIGQLVTIFALAYGLSSPILTTLTGSINRRRLLIFSMTAFSVVNLMAAATPGYWYLVAARVLLAFSAGLYVPNANALASALVSPERRARAIAIVNGGLTVAIALGVPLGSLVGTRFGWRMPFVGVAILSAIAVRGLTTGLPLGVGAGMSATSLQERMAVVRMPAVLPALSVTTFWAVGSYAVYTYIAPFMVLATGIPASRIGFVLFAWGVSAGIGLYIGGVVSDKLRPHFVISTSLPLLAIALTSLSVSAHFLAASAALIPVTIGVSLWGISSWAFFPAQQARLIGIAGVKVAPIVLSLNASFMYLGFSLGAALGGLTLINGTAADLGWIGGVSELIAFGLVLRQ